VRRAHTDLPQDRGDRAARRDRRRRDRPTAHARDPDRGRRPRRVRPSAALPSQRDPLLLARQVRRSAILARGLGELGFMPRRG
jgi:hypothetical protein